MEKKVERLFNAFTELSEIERSAFVDRIEHYQRIGYPEKHALKEELRKSLGPINSAKCPYCGK